MIHETIAEEVVYLLCEGLNQSQVAKKLGISHHELNNLLRRMGRGRELPLRTSGYSLVKDEIRKNIEKRKNHMARLREIDKEYGDTLIKFGF